MSIREDIFYLKNYWAGNEHDGNLSKWDSLEDFSQNFKETQLVLGVMHWTGYLSTQTRRCIYLSVVCSRKKNNQGDWENAFVNTSLKSQGLSLKFWKTRRSYQVRFYNSVLYPLKTPGLNKRNIKLCGSFVDHSCRFHSFSMSAQDIPQAITSTRSQFHVFKLILWGFFLEKSDLERCLGIYE